MANPFPLAIVICDAVHEDPWTLKKTVLGIFSNTAFIDFPAKVRLAVYASFSGGQGVMPVAVQIVDADDDLGSLAAQSLNFDFGHDPFRTSELVLDFVDFTVPSPGPIWIQFFIGNQLIVERRILISQFSAEDQ